MATQIGGAPLKRGLSSNKVGIDPFCISATISDRPALFLLASHVSQDSFHLGGIGCDSLPPPTSAPQHFIAAQHVPALALKPFAARESAYRVFNDAEDYIDAVCSHSDSCAYGGVHVGVFWLAAKFSCEGFGLWQRHG